MLKNGVFITAVCVITFLTQPLFSAPVTIDLELHNDTGECAKYTKNGLKYLDIKYARLVQYGGVKKEVLRPIAGNLACTPKVINGFKYKLECEGVKGTDAMAYTTILVVSAKQQMLSGQIDYRYDESMMGLVKNEFLDVDNLDGQKFQPDQHIAVKRIEINGLKTKKLIQDFGDCQGDYPKRLIADHGIYISSWNQILRQYSWTRTYFDPVQLGEVMEFRA